MNRHLLRVVALSLLSAAIAVAPVRSFAQDNKPATGSKETVPEIPGVHGEKVITLDEFLNSYNL